MTTAKHWTIDLYIDEHDDSRSTRADARLLTGAGLNLHGSGSARRNPADQDVPDIGDELAVARALFDLAHHLLEAAAADIESATHERAVVHA
ncbi:DUF1876 domain-containing protein [Pilimelia columellifera]|uniref:DUF1876 domain-containing protein n=1 Tax=Pilimelia columellifera subsp. columellifera TaxID=706583 RepID=A0ABN3NLB1_9ACTN